jgi:hypothetical protein
MDTTPQVLQMDSSSRRRLAEKLQAGTEILRFEEDPLLASLCACMGLHFEIGDPAYDRLSLFFGVDPAAENPWRKEIITAGEKIGLRLTRKDGRPLEVRHPDFANLLDASSFDEKGELTRLVLFPADIARTYATKGFDLVIVRDWFLNTCLGDDERRVPYLYANRWEIEENIALTQARLLARPQLAFFGTHDIADHLLQLDRDRFESFRPLYDEVLGTFDEVFPAGEKKSGPVLLVSYLLGIVLDDLAQPRWYESRRHEALARMAMPALRALGGARGPTADLPPSFHSLVERLRSDETSLEGLETAYLGFLGDTLAVG